MHEVTGTNANIKPVTNPDVESRTILLQQVLKCRGSFPTNQSWLGHKLPNPEDGEQSGNKFPSIPQVMSILIQSRQMYLVIGHGMEEKSTHLSDFKRGGR